ncbi:uncharacterized protein LOC116221489 [Clupea harengus]|uniref:Uncharacterized protein LOC116221489 n=1 Tax=Clupea harengus TaxID=7950 RepID=A0A6P8FNP0_CLUHA|nr:uncharacterized protein LOC116221489 [Clupea harengus]
MNQTACNDVVEWRMQPSALCLKYELPNSSSGFGACNGTAQFHCQNNSLVLNTVIYEHEGTYMEKIISQDGSVKKIYITLKIISPPLITNVSIISTHSTLIIMCEVRGRNASTRWLKDGVALQNMNLTLMVHEPTWRDCGNYTCLATSEGGSSEAHVNINGAICKKDPDIGHGNGISIWIKSAVICVLGLCIIPICIKKYFAGTCCNKSRTPEDIALQVIAEEQKTDTPPSAHTDPAEADTLTFE